LSRELNDDYGYWGETMTVLGEAIDQVRAQKGHALKEVYKVIGISRNTFYKLRRESGYRFRGDTGKRIARYLGWDVQDVKRAHIDNVFPDAFDSDAAQYVMLNGERYQLSALGCALNEERLQRGHTWHETRQAIEIKGYQTFNRMRLLNGARSKYVSRFIAAQIGRYLHWSTEKVIQVFRHGKVSGTLYNGVLIVGEYAEPQQWPFIADSGVFLQKPVESYASCDDCPSFERCREHVTTRYVLRDVDGRTTSLYGTALCEQLLAVDVIGCKQWQMDWEYQN